MLGQVQDYGSDFNPIIIFYVGIWLLFAYGTSAIAKSKGYSPGSAFLGGLLGGIIALTIAAIMPAKSGSTASTAPEIRVRCIWCDEPIRENAIVCRFCGREQKRDVPRSR